MKSFKSIKEASAWVMSLPMVIRLEKPEGEDAHTKVMMAGAEPALYSGLIRLVCEFLKNQKPEERRETLDMLYEACKAGLEEDKNDVNED